MLNGTTIISVLIIAFFASKVIIYAFDCVKEISKNRLEEALYKMEEAKYNYLYLKIKEQLPETEDEEETEN